MERIRTISLRGGREAIDGVRDTEGRGTSRAVDSSSAKGTLGNRLWEKNERGFYACFYYPSF